MSKQIISLNTMPNTIFFVVLIIGIGAILGMWTYEIFETDKKLTFLNKTNTENKSVSDKGKYFGNKFIQVNSPQKNTIIKNPILVFGKANVFEANIRVRIIDKNGNVLANDFIMADGWMDNLYSFEKEINYKTPQTKNGLLEIFEESAKDGNEVNKIEIPVIFEDYENSSSDWKTYRNDEYGFEFKYPQGYTAMPNSPNNNKSIEIKSSTIYPHEILNKLVSASINISIGGASDYKTYTKKEAVYVNGVKSVQYINIDYRGYTRTFVPFENEKYIEVHNLQDYYPEHNKVYDGILKTLKF